MDKQLVATVLSEIGTLLALKGENSFRCNAYHAAARAIEQMEGDLAEVVSAGKLAEIREYNLNDVRVTRKVYERLIACFGR